MKVEVYCLHCTDNDGNPKPLVIEGQLYINDQKDQSQEYSCTICGASIIVSINTLKEGYVTSY